MLAQNLRQHFFIVILVSLDSLDILDFLGFLVYSS